MKSKKLTIILIILFIITGILMFVVFDNKKINHPVLKNDSFVNTNNSPKITLESKTDEQLAVTVTITPVDVSSQSKEWRFEIVMNNHEIELDQDLIKNTVLVDNQGKVYTPLRWEGAEAGGHHREGVLVFEAINPNPKSIELKISGIKETVRSFIWQLN
ncbi:MAG: hypothetical protein WCW54_01090 [Candidatus Paceibacterota bacterium]